MKNPYKKTIYKLITKFRSEHLSDAIRTTLCIIFPALLFFAMGYKIYAIASGTGALLIAATDGPNTLKGKIRSAVENLLLFAICSVLICYSINNIAQTTILLLIITFFTALIACYGQRYALSGTMATGLCIFIIGLKPASPLQFIFGILTGGAFYYGLSIIHQLLRPFRSLEQAILECLRATSGFVRVKADCYDYLIPLHQAQSQTILQHIKVSEKQQLIRSLLLSENPQKMQRSAKGRKLFQLCITLIDLYQQFSASHHNYQKIRSLLNGTGVLETILRLIKLQASVINQLYDPETIDGLDNEFQIGIQELERQANQLNNTQQQLVSAIADNLKNSYELIRQLYDSNKNRLENLTSATSLKDYQNFISPPPFTLTTLFNQFNFKNPVFRFSLRLALLISVSYVITEVLQLSKYTYWLLLTILVVARPKLALTFRRNYQRIIGTTIGIIVSIALLLLTTNPYILLPIATVLVTAFFYYARLNYLIAVAVLTPSILIGIAVYDDNWPLMFAHRFLFTIAGCLLALVTAYLFPIWETGRIKELLIQTYATALDYLKTSLQNQSANPSTITQLRLARKENYMATAELSQALQLIKIEPHAKKLPTSKLQELQAAAYQFSSIISSVPTETQSKIKAFSTEEAKHAIEIVQQSLDMVTNTFGNFDLNNEIKPFMAVDPSAHPILLALSEVNMIVRQQLDTKN